MVAPIIAAAARKAAPMIRSKGASMMSSSSAGKRKLGSKMMRTTDKKLLGNVDKITKSMQISVKTISKISKGVGKIVAGLAKHSPALKQQMIVLGKGLSLILRPIGDIMAKFLRPMALWVIKIAMKWYSKFGSKTSGTSGDEEDAIAQAEQQLNTAKAFGDPATIKKAEENLATVKAQYSPEEDTGKSGLGKLFGNMIPDAFKETLKSLGSVFKELWEGIKVIADILWTVLGPILKVIATVIGFVIVKALDGLRLIFEGLALAIHVVVGVLKLIASALSVVGDVIMKVVDAGLNVIIEVFGKLREIFWDVYTFLKDNFIGIFDKLITAVTSVYDFIRDKFVGIFDTLGTAIKNLWTKVKDVIDKITFWKKDDDDTGKAVGGMIDTTGMYKLHAGERVMTAGDTSRSTSNNKSMSIVNNISITASISSEMDIDNLARRLAELNETELRRRVSYF